MQKYLIIFDEYHTYKYNRPMFRSFRNIIRFSFSELSGNIKPKGLYFDYQATTPVDYRVLDAMLPYMTQSFGNPHSKTQ